MIWSDPDLEKRLASSLHWEVLLAVLILARSSATLSMRIVALNGFLPTDKREGNKNEVTPAPSNPGDIIVQCRRP